MSAAGSKQPVTGHTQVHGAEMAPVAGDAAKGRRERQKGGQREGGTRGCVRQKRREGGAEQKEAPIYYLPRERAPARSRSAATR